MIVDVNESSKFLQTEMLFSNFFSVPLMTRYTLIDIIMCKGTRAMPGKQKASVIELVVDNSTNNS